MKQLQEGDKKKIVKPDDGGEALAKRMAISSNPYGRENVVQMGTKEFEKMRVSKSAGLTQNDFAFKMISLFEFDNGWLLMQGFGEGYKTLAIDTSLQLQQEYGCKTTSERAMAHLAAQNYVRTLELQKDLSSILNAESYNDFKLRRYQMVSKAYDQANHQYILCIQALKQLKQPPINVTVKTGIANIAQNQLIQENHEA